MKFSWFKEAVADILNFTGNLPDYADKGKQIGLTAGRWYLNFKLITAVPTILTTTATSILCKDRDFNDTIEYVENNQKAGWYKSGWYDVVAYPMGYAENIAENTFYPERLALTIAQNTLRYPVKLHDWVMDFKPEAPQPETPKPAGPQ